MITIDFCEKMSHATTHLDVFRRAVVSMPAIFPHESLIFQFLKNNFSQVFSI